MGQKIQNGPSETCGRRPLSNLELYGLLSIYALGMWGLSGFSRSRDI